MEEGLPYLTAALFCERVIEGKDGVLSAIRIIDRAEVEFGSNDPGVIKALEDAQGKQKIAPAFPITGLVCVKAGSLKGKFNIHIEGQKPSGKRTRLYSFQIELQGGDTGANFILNLTIAVDEDGTHWFDVLFEDRLLTKIPLTIVRKHTQDTKKDAVPPGSA
jgi:hypothetical protein